MKTIPKRNNLSRLRPLIIIRPFTRHLQRSLNTLSPTVSKTNLNIGLAPNIYEKLQIVADSEGRQIDEIIREAIAEWLRARSQAMIG